MALSALERIQEIQKKADQEISQLRQDAVSEVVKKIAEVKVTLRALEEEYSSLTGKDLRGEKVEASARPAKNHFKSEGELAELLKFSIGYKLNRKGLNNAGYSLKSALNLAKSNPIVFGFQKNGPQGEVWLKQAQAA